MEPIHVIILVVGSVVSLVTLIIVLWVLHEKKRTEAWTAVAQSLGFSFEKKVSGPPRYGFTLFNKGFSISAG